MGGASATRRPLACCSRFTVSTASSAPMHMPITCSVSCCPTTSRYLTRTASIQSSARTLTRSSGLVPCPGSVSEWVTKPAFFSRLCIEPRSYWVPPRPWIRNTPGSSATRDLRCEVRTFGDRNRRRSQQACHLLDLPVGAVHAGELLANPLNAPVGRADRILLLTAGQLAAGYA